MADNSMKFVGYNKKSAFMQAESHDDNTVYIIKDTKETFIGNNEHIPDRVADKDYVNKAMPSWRPIVDPDSNSTDPLFLRTGTLQEYLDAKIAGDIDDNTLYFCEDSRQMFKGNLLYSSGYLDEVIDVNVTTWEDVRKIVRAGVANQFFKAGDTFKTKYTCNDTTYDIDWLILGFDHDKCDYTDKYEHTMTIGMKDCTCDSVNWSHRIAFAYVPNHTLNNGEVVSAENVVYGGTFSSNPGSAYLDLVGKYWMYTGSDTITVSTLSPSGEVVNNGLAINSGDIVTVPEGSTGYYLKVTDYTLIGPEGEYDIQSHIIGENISVEDGIDFFVNISDVLHPPTFITNLGYCELHKPIFAGCQLLARSYSSIEIVDIYPNYYTRSPILTFNNSIPSSDGIEYVDTLPEAADTNIYIWYVVNSTNRWYKNVDGIWRDCGVHKEIPKCCPITSRGTTDYLISDARTIINSDAKIVFDPETWVPNQVFGVFDHIPNYDGEGLIYQLKHSQDEDTLKLFDVLVKPTKYVFDGSKDNYSMYAPNIDRYFANLESVDESVYPKGSYYWLSPDYIDSLDSFNRVCEDIENNKPLYDSNGSIVPADWINKGVTFMINSDIELPNGEQIIGEMPVDENTYAGIAIYLPEEGKPINECFHSVVFINDMAQSYDAPLTAINSFNDLFFLLGGAEVCSPRSGQEGMPYEYYSNEISNPTWDSHPIRIKKKVNDKSNPYIGIYWLRSIGVARSRVEYVNYDGNVNDGGNPANDSYYLAPACVIG